MNDVRWCVVMNNLLYPAVLGTLIYTGFNEFSGHAIWGEQAFLALALFVLYVMDYAHSVSEGNRKAYTSGRFLADLVIVACLFIAGNAILGENLFPAVHPAWWLLGTKLAALWWECWGHLREKWPPRKRVEVETDTAFALVYLIVAVGSLNMEIPALVLAAVVAADAFYYYQYESLVAAASKAASAPKAPAKPRVRRVRAKTVPA
ncbi:hypothetical protein SCL_1336 [Sulfuricaulis limicola]|uniref:Uncharacterized protein n=1 Tax=Sulfuricaulis limicola TaxID=1620215 RepID=A0A1B4XFT3_9GAMM|nr:hypothetical protein [Sulfuricaulis limicola]BAV33647.1 hypothetical protein SCL_1336 [Sulfuricaulis limicola]